MTGHPFHFAMVASVQPLLQTFFMHADIGVTDTHLLKTQIGGNPANSLGESSVIMGSCGHGLGHLRG